MLASWCRRQIDETSSKWFLHATGDASRRVQLQGDFAHIGRSRFVYLIPSGQAPDVYNSRGWVLRFRLITRLEVRYQSDTRRSNADLAGGATATALMPGVARRLGPPDDSLHLTTAAG